MRRPESTSRHPIRVVAIRTGLTPATIRAWERRYSAVTPIRSEGGQRLYSDQDVDRLRTLRDLTEAGRSISTVAGLADEAAEALLREDRAAAIVVETAANEGEPANLVAAAYARILELDADGLERTLWRAAMSMNGESFLDGGVAPLLARIGTGWETGEITPGQEHLASDVIDRVLARVAEPSRSPDGPSLVVATLPGERHGLGARLVSATASVDGWRVTYLGTDLPVDDIAATAHRVDARAVAISVVNRDRLEETTRSLLALRQLLDPSVDILLGGRGARLLQADRLPGGVTVFDGLEGLRRLRLNGA